MEKLVELASRNLELHKKYDEISQLVYLLYDRLAARPNLTKELEAKSIAGKAREEVAFKSEYYQGLHDNSSKFQENNWLLPYVEVISSFNFNSLREVGYGNGKFLREISRTVPRVIGLDWAKSSVFSEQNIEIVQQDIGTADLDYVDVNCSADVLEHLPPDTLRSTLSKLHFSSKFNFHVIACYDDGHSHLSILQPDEWLFLFRQLSSAYNIYNITIRSGNVHKVVCAITNAK